MDDVPVFRIVTAAMMTCRFVIFQKTESFTDLKPCVMLFSVELLAMSAVDDVPDSKAMEFRRNDLYDCQYSRTESFTDLKLPVNCQR